VRKKLNTSLIPRFSTPLSTYVIWAMEVVLLVPNITGRSNWGRTVRAGSESDGLPSVAFAFGSSSAAFAFGWFPPIKNNDQQKMVRVIPSGLDCES
jgi:hypothetical protein